MAARKKPNTVTVKKRGNKYMATANWNGHRLRPTFETEHEAYEWGKEQEVRMAKGLDIEEPKHMQQRGIGHNQRTVTLHDLFEHTKQAHWLVSGPNGGPVKSWDKIEIAAKQAVDALGKNARLGTLTVPKVENALKALEVERDNSPATTNRRISALLVMFKEAVRQGWMASLLPLKKNPEVKTGRIFRITPSLEEAMLLYALDDGNQDLYDFIVLSLYMGHRENETLRIRLAESLAHPLDPYCDGSNFVIFPQSSHKNKTTFSHAVPVRPIVQEVIDRRRGSSPSANGYVLGGLDRGKITKAFARMVRTLIYEGHEDILAQKRDNLPVGKDFCIHIMRNEFCSRLGDEGFEVHEIAKFSGHADINTCRRYVKPHRLAHRSMLVREGQVNQNYLPGGEIPHFAPTQPQIAVATTNLAIQNRPVAASADMVIDPAMAVKLVQAMMQAGMGDLLRSLSAEHKANSGT